MIGRPPEGEVLDPLDFYLEMALDMKAQRDRAIAALRLVVGDRLDMPEFVRRVLGEQP